MNSRTTQNKLLTSVEQHLSKESIYRLLDASNVPKQAIDRLFTPENLIPRIWHAEIEKILTEYLTGRRDKGLAGSGIQHEEMTTEHCPYKMPE
jgi:hypothetical protein